MTSLRHAAARLVVVVVCSASALTAQRAEDALVSRLIVAAGGAPAPVPALAALRAVEWRGNATISAGGRTLQIGGLPPEAHTPRTP